MWATLDEVFSVVPNVPNVVDKKEETYLKIPHVFLTRVLGLFTYFLMMHFPWEQKEVPRLMEGLMINSMDHKLTFNYIWGDPLSKNNKVCALVGTKISNDDNKNNNTTTQQPQPRVFVFHVFQPPYCCGFAI